MKDIIRMNQLAGVITESQAKKMMQILNEEESVNEAYSDKTKLKNYLETNALGIEELDIPGKYVRFHFLKRRPTGFESLLSSANLDYTSDTDRDGKDFIYDFQVDKAQIKKFLGM
jgi:hypothetical protein